MQDPHSRILERYRLRPQKKGRLPNYTKDFEQYTSHINQVIRYQVGFSFELNKFGQQKRRKTSKLKNVLSMQERYLTQKSDTSSTSRSNDLKLPEKHLKYNETRIKPDHRIKIRNKSSQKQNRQNSLPVIKQFKQCKSDESVKSNKLPKINLTSRQKVEKKLNRYDKQNDPYSSKSSRIHLHQITNKDKCYTKLFHIVTMGRKQVRTQI